MQEAGPPIPDESLVADHGTSTQRDATLALRNLLPEVERLAQEAGGRNIGACVRRLRETVEATLSGNGEAAQSERLLDWAHAHGITGDAYFVRGALISNAKRTWADQLAYRLWRRTTENALTRFNAETVGYRVLKCLVRSYDPHRHGDDFSAYAEPIVEGVIRRSLAVGRILPPDEVSAQQIDEILAMPLQPEPTAPREPEETASHSATKTPDSLGTRLAHWARRTGVRGESIFQIRGTLIRDSMTWMGPKALKLSEQYGHTSCLSAPDLKTIGYRVVRCLVMAFDPDTHGDSFQAFAETKVSDAMRICAERGAMLLPEKPTFEQVQMLLTSLDLSVHAPSSERTPTPRPASPSATRVERPQRAPETTATPPATSPRPVAPSAPPTPPPTPRPEPPKREETPEEVEERKRQRRFCRWAKDDLKIDVTQEQFEEAVRQVTEKFSNFAERFAHDRVRIPEKFRGGKTAVKKEAVRILPGIVRTFDPSGHKHMNNHISDALELHLSQFVKETAQRQHS